MSVHTAELKYAEQIIGPCELEQDLSWEHGLSVVLRLRDAAGAAWIVKRHGDRDRHAAEVFAYRQWVPALGSNAPRLRAVNDPLAAVILSAVPGEAAPWPAADAGLLSEAARGKRRWPCTATPECCCAGFIRPGRQCRGKTSAQPRSRSSTLSCRWPQRS